MKYFVRILVGFCAFVPVAIAAEEPGASGLSAIIVMQDEETIEAFNVRDWLIHCGPQNRQIEFRLSDVKKIENLDGNGSRLAVTNAKGEVRELSDCGMWEYKPSGKDAFASSSDDRPDYFARKSRGRFT